MGIPTKTKREWALDYLRFLPGQLKGAVDLLPDNVVFDEMARQGFFWADSPGRWFKKLAINDGSEDVFEAMVYGDGPNGPFHWSLKINGEQVAGGTESTAIWAMAAVNAARIMHDFEQSEMKRDED